MAAVFLRIRYEQRRNWNTSELCWSVCSVYARTRRCTSRAYKVQYPVCTQLCQSLDLFCSNGWKYASDRAVSIPGKVLEQITAADYVFAVQRTHVLKPCTVFCACAVTGQASCRPVQVA